MENYHVRLRPHTIGLLAERPSENFNLAVPFGGQRRTFEAMMFETVRNVARSLIGQSTRFDLVFPFGALDGAVYGKAAETISTLTYAGARKLGYLEGGAVGHEEDGGFGPRPRFLPSERR